MWQEHYLGKSRRDICSTLSETAEVTAIFIYVKVCGCFDAKVSAVDALAGTEIPGGGLAVTTRIILH